MTIRKLIRELMGMNLSDNLRFCTEKEEFEFVSVSETLDYVFINLKKAD